MDKSGQITYFFYWYDAVNTPNFTDTVTLHPPDSYLPTLTYANVAFYQHELSDMAAAGIDVALPVYWGDPGNVARWSVPGLHLMAQAGQAMMDADSFTRLHMVPDMHHCYGGPR